MWFNVYYVWKAFILNYSMAEKCGQIDRMHNYLIYRGRKWEKRRGLYEYLLTYMQNIDKICTSIILFEIWRWEYVQ